VKEKQDQARELEKQQRRLADEAKHRQQQLEAKLADDKLHRLAHNDSKRPRVSQRDTQRLHHSDMNDTCNSSGSSHTNSTKGYDRRSPGNVSSGGRARDRSSDDAERNYYSESKRQYTDNVNNHRDAILYA
jgi:hypothetical protein